jgi:hypothetical protein
MSRLHVTNGDSVTELLREAAIASEAVAWRDVLHDGPVPAGLSLEETSRLRARFVSEVIAGTPFSEVHAAFVARDSALRAFRRHDEVTLWFEHDLYDQLQLLQILDWFSHRERGKTRLTMVCIDRHPSVERFLGLGQLDAACFPELDRQRAEVTAEQLDLAARAWRAFCADRPDALTRLLAGDVSALPFLGPALWRHLQQFPWTVDGLSRTERQALQAVADGAGDLRAVFRVSQIEREERPFLSDLAFLFHLRAIAGDRANLLRFDDAPSGAMPAGPPYDPSIWDRTVSLTEIGGKVLKGTADCVRLYGIDRWLGGVRLESTQAAWRWDGRRRTILGFD